MRERLRIFFSLAIFWLGFMAIARVLFMVFNYDLAAALSLKDMMTSMLYGLWMDASMAGYFLALAGLLLTASAWWAGRWIHVTLFVITFVLLIVCGLIVVVDMELYRHWGFRLNTTPLFYMGSGALGSVNTVVVIKVVFIWVNMVLLFTWLYTRYIGRRTRQLQTPERPLSWVLLGISVLMFLPIRGSFSVAPMNTGFVFFHPTLPFANHSAINVVWNFLYSVRKSDSLEYPENMLDKEKTASLFAALYPVNDSTARVLKDKRPNVLFIIIESFTADVIEPLGGRPGIAPNLNQLCREGILFDNFYASGDRTDKGLIAVLSGYPAQTQTSIIKFPAKTQRLPHLNQYLKKLGYKSSFVYGGDVDFANFRSYLTTGGFEHITSMDDFAGGANVSKWGVHDHIMLEQAQRELDTTRAPFFKVVLTLSSHEPFDVPLTPRHIEGNDEESLFLNACYYTDKSLGHFIDYCKKQAWWSNTLVVITADHGHRHPGNKALQDKRRFRIPLLLLGGVIKTDSVVHTLSSQTDIANTLLAQVDREQPDFIFSKNIFGNRAVPFATYFFNDGYGFLLPDTYMVYDNAGKQFLVKENATADDLERSQAYEQKLFSDYNRR